MRITAVIENTSTAGLPVEHGLSLWIEACGRRFFFDLGQSSLFVDNARALGINIREAEFAIISHGHYDHGGGIRNFLEVNDTAFVFLHSKGFTNCYSSKEGQFRYIGLDQSLKNNGRLIFTDGTTEISEGLTLFSDCKGNRCFSPANQRILKKVDGVMVRDDFLHEQSLIIEEGENVALIAGCAHSGILNILAKANDIIGKPITHVIAGLHLKGVDDIGFLNSLSMELLRSNCKYYTCHCTGDDAYQRLKSLMDERIDYISCGETIKI